MMHEALHKPLVVEKGEVMPKALFSLFRHQIKFKLSQNFIMFVSEIAGKMMILLQRVLVRTA